MKPSMLDTDALSEFLRGNPKVISKVDEHLNDYGFRRVRRLFTEYNLPFPELKIQQDGFLVKISDYRAPSGAQEEKTVEKTVEKILFALRNNPRITQQSLIKETGLTRRGIEWNLKKLKNQGKIRRIGPNKGGHWEVISFL